VNYELMLHTLGANNGEISGDVKFTYDEIDNTLVRNASGEKKLIDYILVRNQQWIGNIERKVQTFYEKSDKHLQISRIIMPWKPMLILMRL